MTRSVLLEASNTALAVSIILTLEKKFGDMKEVTRSTSSICTLEKLSSRVVGNLIFLRFEFNTGDAHWSKF